MPGDQQTAVSLALAFPGSRVEGSEAGEGNSRGAAHQLSNLRATFCTASKGDGSVRVDLGSTGPVVLEFPGQGFQEN